MPSTTLALVWDATVATLPEKPSKPPNGIVGVVLLGLVSSSGVADDDCAVAIMGQATTSKPITAAHDATMRKKKPRTSRVCAARHRHSSGSRKRRRIPAHGGAC